MSDEELFLSSRHPSRTQVRTAAIAALLLFIAFLITLPIRNYPLGMNYQILPVGFTTIALGTALTATLLFSQAAVTGSRSLIALATGYLFSTFVIIAEALTYAHLFSEKGLLSAGASTSSWLYLFWHVGFPIAVFSYAGLKTTDAAKPLPRELVRPTIIVCMIGSALLAALLTIVAIRYEQWLPQQMTDAFTWRWPQAALFACVPLALCGAALVPILRKGYSVLDLWVSLVLWYWLIETATALLTTGRFTVGWYVGVVASMLSGILILALLLSESNRLSARLAMSIAAQRRERDGRLLTVNAVAAAMAHEIKQPLTAIAADAYAGFATVQRDPTNIPEVSEIFQSIEKQALRAAEVVSSIRAMVAHHSSERVRLDINELIRETTTLMAEELTASRVTLQLTLDEQAPFLSVDRIQMKHVFLNLVTNAIEAMTAVTERARILVIHSVLNNAGVCISVADSGAGIDAADTGRIFVPFFTTKPQGTGMGLPLCRSIIEGHGGRIWATSEQPFGATFHVQLPDTGD
jgi:signal transduction histidine kinase